MNKRKGSALNGFALIAVGLILFTLPTVYTNGINDFGLATTEGIGVAAEFPPWENRTDMETNINYSNDNIKIADGSKSATYKSLELTNELDQFRLIEADYNTSIALADSSIDLNITVYDTDGTNYQSQVVTLNNNTGVIDLEERLVGERLTIQADLARQTSGDPSPVLHDLSVNTKTLDNSSTSKMWQKMLMLAIIGFSLVLIALLLGG